MGDSCLQPADRFGSPSSEDLDSFVREFNAAFEEALGEELASDIAVEVSSPVIGVIGVHIRSCNHTATEAARGAQEARHAAVSLMASEHWFAHSWRHCTVFCIRTVAAALGGCL